ncbi:MAG: DNA repair protein RecO [Deltaproteobacteria bacterium]|nr:DNA repair protein RecO [Deltaproteobacteria bacterium]
MRFHTTQAIVLGSVDYGESDRVVAFYTQDYGRLHGIAKGAKRSRKRFGGTLEPLSYGRLIFVKKREVGLVRVDHWDLLQGFHGIKRDLERIACGSYFLELAREMTREGQRNPQVFHLLLKSLSFLEGRGRSDSLKSIFEMRLLSALGYHPHLDRCVACKQISIRRPFFSSARGGILCPGCANGESRTFKKVRDEGALIPITLGTAKTLILMARVALDRITRLSMTPDVMRECTMVLEDFIRYQLGKELKSKRFIECIFRM